VVKIWLFLIRDHPRESAVSFLGFPDQCHQCESVVGFSCFSPRLRVSAVNSGLFLIRDHPR
jgi:hypothetical protein